MNTKTEPPQNLRNVVLLPSATHTPVTPPHHTPATPAHSSRAPAPAPPADPSVEPNASDFDSDQNAVRDAVRRMPAAVVDRHFRAHSFIAQIDPAQRTLLHAWLTDESLSLEQVRQKVAAPPPEGFGKQVHINTLYRLKIQIRSGRLVGWIQDSLDTAADVLLGQQETHVAPLREALLTVLYSRAMHFSHASEFDPKTLGQILSAIEKLEKLRPQPQPAVPKRPVAPREPIATRHRVELSIVQQPSAPVVNITAERLSDSSSPASIAKSGL